MNKTIYERLAEPFPVESVHWRVGSTNKKAFEAGKATARKGKPLAYLDARDVMDRLDTVCGPEGWEDEYVNTGNGATCCRISVLPEVSGRSNGNWIAKSDGAGKTDFEGEKGQFSDAFKRAAVKHGIGRYLYGCDSPWIELDEYWRIPKAAFKRLEKSLGPNPIKERTKDVALKNAFIKKINEMMSPGALKTWGKLNADDIQALSKESYELVRKDFDARKKELETPT